MPPIHSLTQLHCAKNGVSPFISCCFFFNHIGLFICFFLQNIMFSYYLSCFNPVGCEEGHKTHKTNRMK